MKKVSLIALLALSINGLSAETAADDKKPTVGVDPAYGNAGYHLMTEDELLLELNEDGIKQYNELDAEGKALARQVASTRCMASNVCDGLNACQSEKNDCAGQGKKGEGKCAVSDANLAVRLVANKMAKKRGELLNKKETNSDKKAEIIDKKMPLNQKRND